jgi:hypothetical protein
MGNDRPGPDIGTPSQQHQVVAILWLLATSQTRVEAHGFLVALEAAVDALWGWTPARLQTELRTCEGVLREYQGRMTFWFTDTGMEFDYECTPPP